MRHEVERGDVIRAGCAAACREPWHGPRSTSYEYVNVNVNVNGYGEQVSEVWYLDRTLTANTLRPHGRTVLDKSGTTPTFCAPTSCCLFDKAADKAHDKGALGGASAHGDLPNSEVF